MSETIKNFDAIFHDATDPILIEDLHGHVVDLNEEAVRSYGFTRDELIGRPIKKIVPPERHEQADDLLRRCRAGEVVRGVEGLRVTRDGHCIPVLLSLSLLSNAAGEPTAIATFAKDITPLRQAEAAQRSRLLLEATPDAMVIVNAQGMIESVNAETERLLDYRRAELIGQPIEALVPEQYRDGHIGKRNAVIDDPTHPGMRGGRELVARRRDGTTIPVEIKLNRLETDEGLLVLAAVRDVSQRKQAQQELRKLSQATEASPASVVVTATDGTIEYVNPKFTEVTGYTPEEAIGKNPRILNAGVLPSNVYQELWETITAGEEWRGEFCNKRKNGDIYWEQASISPIRSDDGTITHFVAVKEDITQRRAAEERFRVLFEQSSDAHLIFDKHGIIDCNHAAVRLLRCRNKDELLSKHPAAFSPEFQPDGRRSDEKSVEMDGLAREQGHHHFEWTHRRMDGDEFPVEVSLTPVALEGRPALLVVWHDLTERKRMEEELRRVNFLSDIALEQTHCGYWHVDYSDPDYYYQSERAARILGEPIKPDGRYHLQHEWFDRLVEANSETAEKTAERYKGAIEGRYENYESTYAYKRPVDGEIVWVHALGKVVRDESGKIQHMYGVYQDITDRVEAEKTLREAKERLTHELAVARELSDAASREHQLCLQGESIPARALRESIEAQSNRDDPLLITGPPGAGQEAVARAIHGSSPRAGRPFIYVACPHVSAADDTIFGTGSVDSEQPVSGKLSLADGGTLFLEGIETLSQAGQEKLLKTLQDAAQERAAGRQPEPDVRMIACASQDLNDAARQGNFDSELAYRLGAKRIAVPSLAERRDDVILLARNVVVERALSLGKSLEGLSSDSEQRLIQYSWPGNLEELQSVVERAVVLASGATVDIPADLLREGPRIGGYSLERKLGAGGMGEVWLARHALLARPSAVKLIRKDALQEDANAREVLETRFRREAQTTAQLRSPHTVELYDFGVTEDGDFYYVMEFLNGLDLDSLVARFGAVDPARAVFLLRQACMSLGEAHLAGLVHRDVKPANLFACKLGPHYDFLKLLDFGIVRTAASVEQTMTAVGQLKGTPATLSPEVVQGEQAGSEADIYGIGCVAYWMLTGKQVFEAPNLMALLVKHMSQTPQPLSEHKPDFPSELEDLVLRCLEKDPADRPGNAFELGELFAAVPLPGSWDNRCAESWWNENLPDTSESGPATSCSETIAIDARRIN